MDLDVESLDAARRLIAGADRIVALTGAGISTDSGIPDFRGPHGVWTRNPAAERASNIDTWIREPEVRRAAWKSRAERMDEPSPRPNAGHRALVDLERSGRLELLVTQNVDGLHLDAGTDRSRLVEIHGTAREVVCLSCGTRFPLAETLQRVRDGEDDPTCTRCSGMLKSATISFGQGLVAEDLARADAAARSSDLLLAVGSTLSVYPIADMVPVAAQAGASVVIVNGGPTEMDRIADVVLRGSISEILPRLVA